MGDDDDDDDDNTTFIKWANIRDNGWKSLLAGNVEKAAENWIGRVLKPGFHYPSWRVTGFHYPSTRAVLTGARFH